MKKILSIPLILLFSAGLIVGISSLFFPTIQNSLYFALNHTIKIETDSDFEHHRFSGSGTYEDPYIIENRVFGTRKDQIKDFYIGLEILRTSKYFVIRNCEFFGGLSSIKLENIAPGTAKIHDNIIYTLSQFVTDYDRGGGSIQVVNSDNVLIEKNVFLHCSDLCKYKWSSSPVIGGIVISRSENTVVRKNTLTPCFVFVTNSPNTTLEENYVNSTYNFCEIAASPNSTLINNIIYTNRVGILIFDSPNILLKNNTIKPITDCAGIYLSGCFNTSILNNSIIAKSTSYNSEYGIILQNSNLTIISKNIIEYFYEYGIYIIEGSCNNTIYHNMFYNNGLDERSNSQGYDEGTENYWFSHQLFQGNFWNDLGLNSTYYIDGLAGSIDFYPLSSPIS